MISLNPKDIGRNVSFSRFDDLPKRGKITSFSIHQVFVKFEGEPNSRPVDWDELVFADADVRLERFEAKVKVKAKAKTKTKAKAKAKTKVKAKKK